MFTPPRTVWGGILLVFLGASCISFSAVFVRLCTVEPEVSSFYRMFFGALVLVLVCLARREPLRAPLRVLVFLGAAAVLLCLDLIFWHRSIYLLGPGLATIMLNFHVFFTPVAGKFLYKERISPGLLFGLPTALLGLSLMLGLHGGGLAAGSLQGLGLGVIAAFWFAGYILLLRQSQQLASRVSPLRSITLVTVGCVGFMALVLVGLGKSFAIPDLRNGLALLGYGVVCQALAWMFLTLGLPRLPASMIGSVMLLQPGLAFVWDILFFGRAVNSVILLGAAVTLAGIFLAVTGQLRRNRAVPPAAWD